MPHSSAREASRLRQLVGLAYEYEPSAIKTGAYLAVPTSVIGLTLLPIAIWAFFFVGREKKLGKERIAHRAALPVSPVAGGTEHGVEPAAARRLCPRGPRAGWGTSQDGPADRTVTSTSRCGSRRGREEENAP